MNNFKSSSKSMDMRVEGGTLKVQLKDGENIAAKLVKRGYLRGDEMNHYIMIYTVAQMIEGIRNIEGKATEPIWDSWSKSGILTKEQKKNLKTAYTFMTKFLNDVFTNNLDVRTKDIVVKRVSKWNVKVVDDYMLKKVYSMLDNAKEFCVDKETFFDLVSGAMAQSCKNCTKNRCECKLHTFLEDYLIPPPTGYGDTRNCEYSWSEEKQERDGMEIVSSNEFYEIMDERMSKYDVTEEKFGNNFVYSENGHKIAEFTTNSGPRVRLDIYTEYMKRHKTEKEA